MKIKLPILISKSLLLIVLISCFSSTTIVAQIQHSFMANTNTSLQVHILPIINEVVLANIGPNASQKDLNIKNSNKNYLVQTPTTIKLVSAKEKQNYHQSNVFSLAVKKLNNNTINTLLS